MILDTNALSAWADGEIEVEKLLKPGDFAYFPIVVIGEFEFGLKQSRKKERYQEFLSKCIPKGIVANLTFETAKHYSDIRLELKSAGTPIPANDIWIAAIARQLDEPILTNDHHFGYVENIKVVNF
jgi:tRNA(fMet)-specific endonuclease VapC